MTPELKEFLISLAALIASLACLALAIMGFVALVRDDISKATLYFILVVMLKVYEIRRKP